MPSVGVALSDLEQLKGNLGINEMHNSILMILLCTCFVY